MKIGIGEMLAHILDQMRIVPQIKTWSNIATPKSQYYNCTTFTLKAKSKYLILACNSNGKAEPAVCQCGLVITPDTANKFVSGVGLNNSGSGNRAVSWAYVETEDSPITLVVRGYGYNTSVTNLNGQAIAIRLSGGGTA